MKPLFDWVQVEPEEAETATAGGILLKGEEDKRVEIAEVLEVGSEMASGLKKGDKVLFKGYAVDEIVIKKEKLFFLKESDIIAKV